MPKFFASCLHAHLLIQELSWPTIKSTDTGVILPCDQSLSSMVYCNQSSLGT